MIFMDIYGLWMCMVAKTLYLRWVDETYRWEGGITLCEIRTEECTTHMSEPRYQLAIASRMNHVLNLLLWATSHDMAMFCLADRPPIRSLLSCPGPKPPLERPTHLQGTWSDHLTHIYVEHVVPHHVSNHLQSRLWVHLNSILYFRYSWMIFN